MINTIRGKLRLANLLVIILALGLFQLIMYFSLKVHLYNQADAILLAECEEVGHLMILDNQLGTSAVDHEWEESSHTTIGENAIYLQMALADRRTVYRSENVRKVPQLFLLPESGLTTRRFRNVEINNSHFRTVDYPVFSDRDSLFLGTLSVGYLMDGARDYLDFTRNLFLIIAPTCLLLAWFLIGFILKRTLRPISRVIGTANNIIDSRNLQLRISEGKTDRELVELITVLNHLFEELEQAFTRVQNFTGDVSHELRTPLTVLSGNIELLLSGNFSPAETQTTAESILEEVTKITRIVEELLLLTRLDSGALDPESTLIELGQCIAESLQTLEHAAGKKNIRFEQEIERAVRIFGVTSHVRVIINNLIENAIQYSRSGGSVQISLVKDERFAVLAIADHGIGISAEDSGRIFERFYRVDKSRSRESGGTGLGLAIVKRIVQQHRGSISLESQPGEGSRFTVSFPLAKVDADNIYIGPDN